MQNQPNKTTASPQKNKERVSSQHKSSHAPKPTVSVFQILLSLLLFLLVALCGFGIFSAICNANADWSEITSPTIDTEDLTAEEPPTAPYGDGFLADMTEYEQYINPIHEKRDSFLILVNRKNALSADNVPDTMIESANTHVSNKNTVTLNLYAAKALEAMFIEMRAQGVFLVDSKTKTEYGAILGYRSYEAQSLLFEDAVSKLMKNDPTLTRAMAEDIAEASALRPGTDEHQTGLCVDIHSGSSASIAFKDSEMFAWLSENAWKFGFILRYPENKTNITGMTFEPWHFRYVGRYHAGAMKKLDMCLEEYLAYLEE